MAELEKLLCTDSRVEAVKKINAIIDNTGGDFNNKITNCLLEVPQRIKYDLTDGVLTIKAGSVVIVPYGVEDLTESYPVGSTFLNDNFKVVDTQFADDKFFVWAELVGDVTNSKTVTDTKERFIWISTSTNEIEAAVDVASGTSITGTALFYDTDNNTVDYYNSGVASGKVMALPLGIVTSNSVNKFASINQVFNGMGYIGSTYWIDKGVKGFIPNGRNTDGSLNNIEFTTPKLATATLTAYTNNNMPFGYNVAQNTVGWSDWLYVQEEKPNDNYSHWYKPSQNMLYYAGATTGDYQPIKDLICGFLGRTDGMVTEWNPKEVFHAVDYNDLQEKVSKSGDTMTGTLQISQSTNKPMRISSQTIDITSAPTSNQYSMIEFLDKNNQRVGIIGGVQDTNGNYGVYMQSGHSGAVMLRTDGSTPFVTALTPATTDNSTKIATTAFVRSVLSTSGAGLATISKAGNGYCKFNNGVIIQWGAGKCASGKVTVTYPTAFSSVARPIVQHYYIDGNVIQNLTVTALSKTNFSLKCSGTEDSFYWIAVGY